MSQVASHFHLNQLAYAFGRPQASALLKQTPEDFVVEEQIAYELTGDGEHLWCWIEKIGQNTDWVAKQLAEFVGINPKNVGTAGKKDRQARTYQWMSLYLPGRQDPDFSKLALAGVKVLKTIRHQRKLQTGGLRGNLFNLTLRDVAGEKDDIEHRLQKIQKGFPNYFGEQRFGHDYGNLAKATELFRGKLKQVKPHQKGLYLSAARSWLFNELLSLRIEQDAWQTLVPGDVYQLSSSSRCFSESNPDLTAELVARLAERDIHPTGLLTGRGDLLSQGLVAQWERSIMERFPLWQKGLEKAGLKQERRPLRVVPEALSWQWQSDTDLSLNFGLPAGSYATMLVREVCCLRAEDESGSS